MWAGVCKVMFYRHSAMLPSRLWSVGPLCFTLYFDGLHTEQRLALSPVLWKTRGRKVLARGLAKSVRSVSTVLSSTSAKRMNDPSVFLDLFTDSFSSKKKKKKKFFAPKKSRSDRLCHIMELEILITSFGDNGCFCSKQWSTIVHSYSVMGFVDWRNLLTLHPLWHCPTLA